MQPAPAPLLDEQPATNGDTRPSYLVGIGASAGGLEALERLFEKMPTDTGLAFVVVQHLSPDFKSLTDELLGRRTHIPIHRVENGMAVQRNAIYLLPPKKDMIVSDGKLWLSDKDPTQMLALPIDIFFRSLAQDAGDRAIAVVLSGTGSDGSRGIRDVHDAGGLVITQTPESAKFDGMPKSALQTGTVDFTLTPEEMPDALLRYIKENLQATIEELETSNEELQATNEELVATNEELQSTNEELHSVNEELYTVNGEYQKKIAELTELTAVRDALSQRDRFLAMLSHELRNPLAAILNSTLLIEKLGPLPPNVGDWFKVIERRARHMARLLDDLLDVVRIMQNKIDIRKRTFDLALMVHDVVEEVRPHFEERRQELAVTEPGERLPVDGDPDRLQQIQVNLLLNASKYTPEGGCIRYALARQGDEAVIRVRDTGRGIAPEMLESIFDLFVQADDTLDRAHGGIGVGLTLVRSIVELHGGRVRAFSDGPGQGSEFVVWLPLSRQELPGARAADEGDGAPRARRCRVLVVEDDADIRGSLRDILALEGYEVRTAADGLAALDELERERPDIALVDIGLPGLDGYEVCRRVRRRFAGAPFWVFALTGYGRASDQQAAREAGFDAHLTKPIKVRELFRLLDGVRPKS
jgi:chemotaxis response regulator CheB/nitrogen-specific signal transduction histidine kinase